VSLCRWWEYSSEQDTMSPSFSKLTEWGADNGKWSNAKVLDSDKDCEENDVINDGSSYIGCKSLFEKLIFQPGAGDSRL
jgi:hypothetical protein